MAKTQPNVMLWFLPVVASLAIGGHVPSTKAESVCRPLAPEAEHDLRHTELPTNETRWRVAERVWREVAPSTKNDVEHMLKGGGLDPASDIIQGKTNDLFRESIRQQRYALAHDLLELWEMPLRTVSSRNHVLALYVQPGRRIGELHLDRHYSMWVGPDGIETVLYSAMYLAGAMDVAKAIVNLPETHRTDRLNEFVRQTLLIAGDHYLRWSFALPGLWQVRGWGCATGGLTLLEFTQRRLDYALANGGPAYCNAPTDLDMLIAIGIANFLSVSARVPELAPVALADRTRLEDMLRLQARFMASRLRPGETKADAQAVATIDFDPGSWATHEDRLYASDEGENFPTNMPKPNGSVGWDFSHGVRIAWMMLSFAESPVVNGVGVDWHGAAASFSRQVAYKVLGDDPDLPQFRNYLDGSNGWYRVNYAGTSGTGTPPFGLSRAFFYAPWARLSSLEPRLAKAATGAWRLLTAATPAHCALLQHVYIDGYYWRDRKPLPMALSGMQGGLHLLPFLAVTPVSAR